MCVVALAWRPEAGELVVIANRDEAHARPTAPLGWLPEAPGLCGGRDLDKGGGWLWARADGRLAAVTNVRRWPPVPARRSRGELVARFAAGDASTQESLRELGGSAEDHGPFHLLVFDGHTLGHASNVPRYEARVLPPGITAVSNGPLDEPWVKSQRLAAALERWLGSSQAQARELAPLFAALADERPVPDERLPETGVGIEMERVLAPPFIRGEQYGTRSSSVVVMDRGELVFAERRFGAGGEAQGEQVVRMAR